MARGRRRPDGMPHDRRESDIKYEETFARVSLRLPKTTLVAARRVAQSEGVSLPELVRLYLVTKVAESVAEESEE